MFEHLPIPYIQGQGVIKNVAKDKVQDKVDDGVKNIVQGKPEDKNEVRSKSGRRIIPHLLSKNEFLILTFPSCRSEGSDSYQNR